MASSANKSSSPEVVTMELNDVTITWVDGKFDKARSSNDKSKSYTIEGEKIETAELIPEHNIIVLKTKSSYHFRFKNNRRISGSKDCTDYYYEPNSSSFYRKDSRGHWYDTEGVKLHSTIILKNELLISLKSKVSKRNQIFKNQKPYISTNSELVQIGKIVLDNNLIPVTYYNEKITGLGRNVIKFNNGEVFQEILLGLNRTAYINESNKQPLIINGLEPNAFNGKIDIGDFSYYIFENDGMKLYLDMRNSKPLDIGNLPFIIDSKSHKRIAGDDLVKVNCNSINYYFNLTQNRAFSIPELGDSKILKIEKSNVAYNDCELINLSTKKKSIVIKSDDLSLYLPGKNTIQIEKIKNVPGFEGVFAFVTLLGKQQLYSLHSQDLILLENDAIVAVDGHSKNKLLNAITANGQRIALDMRKGFKDLIVAKSNGSIISQTESEPYNVGSKILQNVKIQTLGGVQERVIDLNSESLSIFKLPNNMMTYSDGDESSVFAGLEIIRIDYNNVIEVEEHKFLSAQFRSFDDELQTVMIEHKSGRPLRMDGLGHKLELVTSFNNHNSNKTYQIGPHIMIGASTLKEDLKTDELLFSTKIMSSWIPFSDGYLPILKQIVEVNELGSWEYHLFELRTLSTEKEFLAVEQKSPYRILVKNKGGNQEPIVVKTKEKVLKSPQEISMISKLFFTNTSILADVY